LTLRLRLFLFLYDAAWTLGLPLVLAYLLWRSRRDRDYRCHIVERLGFYRQRMHRPVWIHAVSLGELRAAAPLARALLDRGEGVVFTHLTPAGRREAHRIFAAEIQAGRVASVWMAVDASWAVAGFFRAFRPRLGLVIEIEHWPRMILAARARGVPLFPCNAQYPRHSFEADRDRRHWRREVMALYAGAFVKSELQAERFRAAGVAPVEVTGETRFDLPVPPHMLEAGARIRDWFGPGRPIATFASTETPEDDLCISAILQCRAAAQAGAAPVPAFLWVPRRAEWFDHAAATLQAAGLTVLRRSQAFDGTLQPLVSAGATDVLLCDSIGEMFAFLAAADRVVVGGGFTAKGIHNIIEPLALGRAVITGPATGPYEYPFEEARAAGLAVSVADAAEMAAALMAPVPGPAEIEEFCAAHRGAVARTFAALDRLVPR
jgi:3-deoxy-D-manno-octulosonic-acid transferase